jgi:soluble lytic murein transglycosylase
MRASGRLIGSALLLSLALGPADVAEARGPMYRYLDERGVIHFSNVPPDARYRLISTQPRGLRWSKRSEPPREKRYDPIILEVSREHGVEPALVKAVIAAESNFDPTAVSKKGAQGLMQLMPRTAESLGVRDPFEPDENVGGGTRYLKRMLDRYGDVSRALAAYNAGPEAVDRHRGIPPYRETRAYVARVLTYYRGYHGEIGAR